MWKRVFRTIVKLLGLSSTRPGKGNQTVYTLYRSKQNGWVSDVTGEIVWIKKIDENEKRGNKINRKKGPLKKNYQF